MLLDCGLMFPDLDMPGIDLVLPDFTYLRENADRVEGCIITHGHEDHCGGLSFLLRELSFPIYGSALTLGLARSRIEEAGLLDRTQLISVRDGERRQIGPFDVEFIPVTHSVPHGFATAFHTPQGVILHSGDFKIDLTPVDGRATDLARIGALADGPGIRLLLSDSTNAEEEGHTDSERRVGGCSPICSRPTPTSGSSWPASPATSTGSSRSPTPRSPTGGPSPPWAVRWARTSRWPGPWACCRSPTTAWSTSSGSATSTPAGSASSRPDPRASPCRLWPSWPRRTTSGSRSGSGDLVVLSSHAIPGNETNVGKVIDGL